MAPFAFDWVRESKSARTISETSWDAAGRHYEDLGKFSDFRSTNDKPIFVFAISATGTVLLASKYLQRRSNFISKVYNSSNRGHGTAQSKRLA
jgi:hypothetical protein